MASMYTKQNSQHFWEDVKFNVHVDEPWLCGARVDIHVKGMQSVIRRYYKIREMELVSKFMASTIS